MHLSPYKKEVCVHVCSAELHQGQDVDNNKSTNENYLSFQPHTNLFTHIITEL